MTCRTVDGPPGKFRMLAAFAALPLLDAALGYIGFPLVWQLGGHGAFRPVDPSAAAIGFAVLAGLIGAFVTIAGGLPVVLWMMERGRVSPRAFLVAGLLLGNAPFALYVVGLVLPATIAHVVMGTMRNHLSSPSDLVLGVLRVVLIGSAFGVISGAVFWALRSSTTERGQHGVRASAYDPRTLDLDRSPAALVAQQPQRPLFRAETILVPVDVRVVDPDGSAVNDIGREEFTVFENGVAQEISHFSVHAYQENLSRAGTDASASDGSPSMLVAPSYRTFVFVLGCGRLRGPSRGLGALIDFVRTGINPTDRLAVVAYDRITHITSDRDAVVRLLQGYDERHEELEALLDHWYSSPLSSYMGIDPPPNLQRRIDDLFGAPGLPPMRHLLSMPPEVEGQLAEDQRRAFDSDANGTSDFVAFASAGQDLEKLHATIDYLRLLEGEKHVIFLTEEGLNGATKGWYGETLARLAADARVTVSTIHTGGLPLTWHFGGRTVPKVWLEGPTWNQQWLTPASYEASLHDGIALRAVVDATASPRHVKAVVYDFAADRVGSAFARVK